MKPHEKILGDLKPTPEPEFEWKKQQEEGESPCFFMAGNKNKKLMVDPSNVSKVESFFNDSPQFEKGKDKSPGGEFFKIKPSNETAKKSIEEVGSDFDKTFD